MRGALANRSLVPRAPRIVVKIGSSSLTRPDGTLDRIRLAEISEILGRAKAGGQQIALVSSGAVAAGVGTLRLPGKPTDLATLQAAAMVGQSGLMAAYTTEFSRQAITAGQVLLTADDVVRRTHYSNVRGSLRKLLALGVLPIINENDAVTTDELRLGDNDRLAALVAHLVSADVLILLTDVDGLYSGPPTDPASRPIDLVASEEDLVGLTITGRGSAVGTGGMATKVTAARMASAFGIPTIITSADRLSEVMAGENVGTWFAATGNKSSARDLWIVHAAQVRGVLTVDDGAARAISTGNHSLLPVGLCSVSGSFGSGDCVEVRTQAGDLIARGLVGWNSDELENLCGTKDVGRPAIHVDDLVLVRH